MVNKIEQDHQRFRQIVRGKIRRDLRRFIAKGELIGKEGQRFVAIPIHDIDIPTFRYGDNSGGVGNLEHIYEGLTVGGASAALAASIFHFQEYSIAECKTYLASRGVTVRAAH